MVVCACILFTSGAIGQDADDCEALLAVLGQRREKLAEYIDALKMSHERGDMVLVQAFCHKIDTLAEEIRQAENSRKCPQKSVLQVSPGLSPIKSDATNFVTQSCGDLRRMQVMLLIKINALRRRDQSVFSQLNAKEKESLDDANETLKNVKNALRSRCPEEPQTTKAKRRARPEPRQSPAIREVR